MKGLTFANAADLSEWAASRLDARATLPRLVRRLIHATVTEITRIGFPADEGIQLEGWDGIVTANSGTAFVPAGTSVWELSTSKDIKGKADQDYGKRTADPLGLDPKSTTYVCVTPRCWGEKEAWTNRRKEEDKWLDVRAYDANSLEEWLELAPAVHAWLSVLLGKRPEGIQDLSTAWEEWSEATQPQITPGLMVAGRDEQCERIGNWLAETPSLLALAADTREEAIAFFAATLYQIASDSRIPFLARVVIVKDHGAWYRLASLADSLIMIPTFDALGVITKAIKNGHYVLAPLEGTQEESPSLLRIPRLRRQPANEALKAMGLSKEDAYELAKVARHSVTTLRRRLSLLPGVRKPEWSGPPKARTLLPAMLVGAWDDSNAADGEIMAELAGMAYEEYCSVLTDWAYESDPAVRKTGDSWMIVSKLDAWELLAKFLTTKDLNSFEDLSVDVLAEVDPRYELPPGERWLAQSKGKTLSNSGLMRKGLADTIALVGARSDSVRLAGLDSGQERANRIIHRLLNEAQKDWRLWASLSQLLPLLAEAAPEVFLQAVELGVSARAPILERLFHKKEEEGAFESSPHTGLLWALETLAWNPIFLSQVSLLLGRLVGLDPNPESNYMSRPANSLREIFLTWHPGTCANATKRLAVIDLLRDRESSVAWKLMIGILPQGPSMAVPTHRPIWRDWSPDSPTSVPADLWQTASEIADRLLADVGTSGDRWIDLLTVMNNLAPEQRKQIIESLLCCKPDDLGGTDQTAIRTELRQIISHHRAFPDADWSLPTIEIDLLEQAYEQLEPSDLKQKNAWLFSDSPDMPNIPREDWEQWEEALDTAQGIAVHEVYAQGGIQSLLEISACVEQPGTLGFAVGKSDLLDEEEDTLLRDELGSDQQPRKAFCLGFISGRFKSKGWEWVEKKRLFGMAAWRPEQRADFLVCVPFEFRTWEHMGDADEDTKRAYWSAVSPRLTNPEDAERATTELVKYGRPAAAIEMITMHSRGQSPLLPPSRIAGVLEQVVHGPRESDAVVSRLAYRIAKLLDFLESTREVDDGKMAMFEWAFMPILEDYRTPKLLHGELARDPSFFVQLLGIAFKAENEPEKDYSEEESRRAMLVYKLLQSWRVIPGTEQDGLIDEPALQSWVEKARTLAASAGHTNIADIQIGHILAYSRVAPDGTWPDSPVRSIIEQVASSKLEHGFEVQVYNKRGVFTKSEGEGGTQERQLGQKYRDYATGIDDSSPRTAAMLRGIADRYEAEAVAEDERDELAEDLG